MVCHTFLPSQAAIPRVSEIGAWTHVNVERTFPIEEMQVLLRLSSYHLPLLTMHQVWDGISDARTEFNAAALE